MTWSHQIKLTCGRRFERLHPNPAFGGGAQEAGTLLPVGWLDQRTYRFGHPSIRRDGEVLEDGDRVWARFSGGLHHRAFDDDAGGDVLPKGDEQFARQGDDGGPVPGGQRLRARQRNPPRSAPGWRLQFLPTSSSTPAVVELTPAAGLNAHGRCKLDQCVNAGTSRPLPR
jgi:hypothetical protein